MEEKTLKPYTICANGSSEYDQDWHPRISHVFAISPQAARENYDDTHEVQTLFVFEGHLKTLYIGEGGS